MYALIFSIMFINIQIGIHYSVNNYKEMREKNGIVQPLWTSFIENPCYKKNGPFKLENWHLIFANKYFWF